MKPLAHDAPSPQAQFEEAVRKIRVLADTISCAPTRAIRNPDASPEMPVGSQLDDLPHTYLEERAEDHASEDIPPNVLHDLELELQRILPQGVARNAHADSTAEEAPAAYGSSSRAALPERSDEALIGQHLPSLGTAVAIITFAQVATGIILFIAVATWLSAHSDAPPTETAPASLHPHSEVPGPETRPSAFPLTTTLRRTGQSGSMADSIRAPVDLSARRAGRECHSPGIAPSGMPDAPASSPQISSLRSPPLRATALTIRATCGAIAAHAGPLSSKNASHPAEAHPLPRFPSNIKEESQQKIIRETVRISDQMLQSRALLELKAKLTLFQRAKLKFGLREYPEYRILEFGRLPPD